MTADILNKDITTLLDHVRKDFLNQYSMEGARIGVEVVWDELMSAAR